jgi:hypothetical protein
MYNAVMLPAVVIATEDILRVFENGGQGKPQEGGGNGTVHSTPNTIRVIKPRKMRCTEHVARMGHMINAYMVGGRPEHKTQVGRLWSRYDDNIKMDVEKVCDKLQLSGSEEGAVADSCVHSTESSGSIKSENRLPSSQEALRSTELRLGKFQECFKHFCGFYEKELVRRAYGYMVILYA